MMKHLIYVTEDDENIRNLICVALESFGYTTRAFETAEEALEAVRGVEGSLPSLFVFDWMLPGMDGMAAVAKLKASPDTRKIPVMMLTAKDSELDVVAGLDGGADDYMTKPFLPKELVLRIGAILRRTCRKERQTRIFQVGKREVDLDAGLVRFREKGELRELSLTNKEYQLLKLFLENRGRILTLDVISETVWGENYYGFENTLMVHIRKLREKIEENPSAPRWLITVKGLGYRLNQ